MLVAFETGFNAGITEPFSGLELAGGAGLLALTLHGRFKTGQINIDLALAADVGGKIDREPVGVVQRKQGLAIEDAPGRQTGQCGIKNFHAVFKGFAETLFFLTQDLLDTLLLCDQFGVGVTHLLHQVAHQAMEEHARLP